MRHEDFLSEYDESSKNSKQIISKLKEGELDFGILSTPLYEKSLKENILYHEPYVLYATKGHKLLSKKIISPEDLDPNEIWSLKVFEQKLIYIH